MLNLKMYQDQKGKLGKIWLWRNYVVTMNKFKQGDIVWANFSPSVGQEMKGKHPTATISLPTWTYSDIIFMVV
nr:type II toxin-antitoxin system PemK/MazF family toxin [Lactobacillus johnsonii]